MIRAELRDHTIFFYREGQALSCVIPPQLTVPEFLKACHALYRKGRVVAQELPPVGEETRQLL